jgi:hypothetical protein
LFSRGTRYTKRTKYTPGPGCTQEGKNFHVSFLQYVIDVQQRPSMPNPILGVVGVAGSNPVAPTKKSKAPGRAPCLSWRDWIRTSDRQWRAGRARRTRTACEPVRRRRRPVRSQCRGPEGLVRIPFSARTAQGSSSRCLCAFHPVAPTKKSRRPEGRLAFLGATGFEPAIDNGARSDSGTSYALALRAVGPAAGPIRHSWRYGGKAQGRTASRSGPRRGFPRAAEAPCLRGEAEQEPAQRAIHGGRGPEGLVRMPFSARTAPGSSSRCLCAFHPIAPTKKSRRPKGRFTLAVGVHHFRLLIPCPTAEGTE